MAELPTAEREALQKLHGEKFTGIVPDPSGFAILTIFARGSQSARSGCRPGLKRLATSGIVRQSISVAGFVESDAAFKQYPKPEGWERDLHQQCDIRNESHAEAVKRLEQALAEAESRTENKPEPKDMIHLHQALAQLHAFTGDLEASIKEEGAGRRRTRLPSQDLPTAAPFLEEALGASLLASCWDGKMALYRDSGDIDIFPPPNESKPYQKQANSRMAIKYFQDSLDNYPDDLQVRWLLNLAYVTVGEYPAGVPAKFLMPRSLFESKENIGRFVDVAPAAGLNVFGDAGGVLVDDFENNGRLDVITSERGLSAIRFITSTTPGMARLPIGLERLDFRINWAD